MVDFRGVWKYCNLRQSFYEIEEDCIYIFRCGLILFLQDSSFLEVVNGE